MDRARAAPTGAVARVGVVILLVVAIPSLYPSMCQSMAPATDNRLRAAPGTAPALS
jgi:Na+/proline symporter